MSTQTSDLLEAACHIPSGGKLILYDVTWEEYEAFLEQIGDSPRFRTGYDNGRLEIMTLSFKHEKYKSLIHGLIQILGDERDQEIIGAGSFTMKVEKKRKGAEPDECFYIQHAALIGDQDNIDLRTDPPPDLVVEIDVTRDSSTRFPIYAGLGVPEAWRYDGGRVSFWRLDEGSYIAAVFSPAFPFLTADHVTQFIANCGAMGPKAARRVFRDWVRAAKPGT